MKKFFPLLKKANLISILCVIYLCNQSFGQKQSYLEGLPSRNDIITKIKGNSPKETYGKRIAALKIMCDMIILHEFEEEPKNERTVKENELLKEYNSWGILIDEYSSKVENLETSEQKREFRAYIHNLKNDELRKELVNNLFSNDARTQYEKVKKLRKKEALHIQQAIAVENERKKAIENQKIINKIGATISIIFGVALLILPIKLLLWIGKRKFNRLNQHGVEEFKDYSDFVKTRLIEESVGWLYFFALVIGIGLIIYGGYLFSL